eukprot:4478204-Pyramimonas_sp.AAC.1
MARFSALARAAHFAGNAVRNQTQNHVLTTVRPFASAADVARVSDDSFCKWTNPVPQTRLHTADLAGPETKVRFPCTLVGFKLVACVNHLSVNHHSQHSLNRACRQVAAS